MWEEPNAGDIISVVGYDYECRKRIRDHDNDCEGCAFEGSALGGCPSARCGNNILVMVGPTREESGMIEKDVKIGDTVVCQGVELVCAAEGDKDPCEGCYFNENGCDSDCDPYDYILVKPKNEELHYKAGMTRVTEVLSALKGLTADDLKWIQGMVDSDIGNHKITNIKTVRAVLGIGLFPAKCLVEEIALNRLVNFK
jgi:hypothetical protein